MTSASFFVSWHWIGTLLTMVPEESRPSLLRVCADRRTIAVGLLGERLERRRHGLIQSRALYLNETGDPQHNLTPEYNEVIGLPSYQKRVVEALIGWFATQHAHLDELHVNGASRDIARQSWADRLNFSEIRYPSYWVELRRLQAGNGDICSSLSRNGRQQLRRAIRNYDRYGTLELRRASSVNEAQSFFSGMKRFHITTWERRGKAHSFSSSFFEQFHRNLIERSFADGVIEMIRASAGSHVIGYLYNFRYRSTIYAYQSGFDYETAGARPGAVTHALAIREAYRSGATAYDFMAGWNRLKQDFATSTRSMFWTTIQQPRPSFALENMARRLKQRASVFASAASGPKKPLRSSRVLSQDHAAN